jgi:hypothetical protein
MTVRGCHLILWSIGNWASEQGWYPNKMERNNNANNGKTTIKSGAYVLSALHGTKRGIGSDACGNHQMSLFWWTVLFSSSNKSSGTDMLLLGLVLQVFIHHPSSSYYFIFMSQRADIIPKFWWLHKKSFSSEKMFWVAHWYTNDQSETVHWNK